MFMSRSYTEVAPYDISVRHNTSNICQQRALEEEKIVYILKYCTLLP